MFKIIMLVALGFLVASLFALMLSPFLWRRAVRLTTRRIQGTTPLSMSDIQADKDQLRAEFAMSTRKLEMNVDNLKQRTNNQLLDISKHTSQVNDLTAELKEKSDLIVAHEDNINEYSNKLLRSEDEARNLLKSFKEATVNLRQARDDMDDASRQSTDARTIIDEQKVELAALKTRLAAQEQSTFELTAERDNLTNEVNIAADRFKSMDSDLDALKLTADDRGNRLEKLTRESSGATAAHESAQKELVELRTEVTELRQQAQNGWDEERMENAILRERLNDVSAEVARMALAFEGSAPEIETILEQEEMGPADAANGTSNARSQGTGSARKSGKGKTLADRIRALQAQVSRA
ncbi:MAG: hypothetical protein JKY32_15490 [Rhizobiales bacterium]|nr:hypothetical protein [Hyphomicrobiales bacterium]